MNNNTVLVMGHDGYIGHALTLRLLKLGYKVIGLDDLTRRRAVENQMESVSAIDIDSPYKREEECKKYGEFVWFSNDTAMLYDPIYEAIEKYKPATIFNLANQPSAPYSHIDNYHCMVTATTNIFSTMNVIWAMKEHVPDAHLIQIGSMGEYDPNINIDIEEGLFSFKHKGRKSKESLFPRRPGSFYHASKVCASYYLDAAGRFWGLKSTDIMQGVVYGNWTPEIEETGLETRLDTDEAFGTVVNRFAVQSLMNTPMTIFGSGKHKRGFLALDDSIQCLQLALENPPSNGYQTWNQLDTIYSMEEVAEAVQSVIGGKKQYIETPRVEHADTHYYNPITKKLENLGFEPQRSIKEEVQDIARKVNQSNFEILKNVVIPKISW